MSSTEERVNVVVVVGAGLSGLMACHVLSQTTTNIRIYLIEARNRLGGRVETIRSESGMECDVGAQWIGPTHTELLQLIQQYSSTTDTTPLQLVEQYYPSQQQQQQPQQQQKQQQRWTECVGFHQRPLTEQDQQLIQDYITLIDTLSSEIDIEEPWTHPMAQHLDTMSIQDHLDAHIPTSFLAKQELALFYQTVLASRVDNVSFFFLLLYLKRNGGINAMGDGEEGLQKWKLNGGMIQLITYMEQTLLQRGVTILTSSPVETITDQGTGLVLTMRKNNNGPTTTTINNKIYADRAILALSPQLVTQLTFEPPLDQDRMDLGQAFLPGKAMKVILSFDTPFWLQQRDIANDAATLAFTNGPIHNLFHSTLGDTPALVGLITGAAAEDCESLSDEELQRRIVHQIQTMYQVQQVPHCVIVKRWGLEEFSGGCYAGVCPPDGSLVRLGKLLQTPVGKYHWASTETATIGYGYMEGALLAGKRAANEVLEYYTKLNPPS